MCRALDGGLGVRERGARAAGGTGLVTVEGALVASPRPVASRSRFAQHRLRLDEDACVPAFEGYVGRAYDDSGLDYWGVPPSADAWAAGDRSLFCLLDSGLYNDGEGSARGSEE